MNTASIQFLGFAVLAALVYNLWDSIGWRRAVLLSANLLFLFTFSRSIISWIPFAVFLLFGYLGVRIARKPRAHGYFVPFVVFTIALFAWLKKYSIFPAETFLASSYVTVGLSYILFRVLHLMIDEHAQTLPKKIGFLSYLNYTLNFMTLVSGPIQRYEEFEKSENAAVRPQVTVRAAGEGLHRIVTGFFKVTVLSWIFAGLQKELLASLGANPLFLEKVLTAGAIGVSYTLYLFFNFSGYTDIVIGVGKYFGFTLPENFDRPFSCGNYMSFWSRWHITLSDWLKTYVYNPLLMASMRRWPGPQWEPFLVAGSLFVTFFIVGIWHGRTSEFFVFGVLQGFGIAANRFYQILMAKKMGQRRYRTLASNPLYVALCRGLTFTYFTFSLFWFWSSWQQMGNISKDLHLSGCLDALLLVYVAATIALALLEFVRSQMLSIQLHGRPFLLSRYSLTVFDTSLAVCSLAVGMLLKAPPPEIVYKAF